MRCQACDKRLTEFELTRKSATSEEFLDLCNECYNTIRDDVQAVERTDLMSIEDVVDFNDETW